MHTLEPYYNWIEEYSAAEDDRSPFYGREYDEFGFTHQLYNFLLHPQWDEFGSETLYTKILYADYDRGFAILEFIGEWNDCLHNDIMHLKTEVLDILVGEGINKFILIGENVLNYHASDDCYYEEWFQDLEDGWVVALNFREHVIEDFNQAGIDYYWMFGGDFDQFNWRRHKPLALFQLIAQLVVRRLPG